VELSGDLPADIDPDTCVDKTEAPDLSSTGAVAYLMCGGSISDAGPTISFFYRYLSRGDLTASFREDAERVGIQPFSAYPDASYDCPAYQGYRDWSFGSNTGEVGCFIDSASGMGYVFWTQHNALAKALVGISNGSNGGLERLWEWWDNPSNSDLQSS
jgi:hypothetical protein